MDLRSAESGSTHEYFDTIAQRYQKLVKNLVFSILACATGIPILTVVRSLGFVSDNSRWFISLFLALFVSGILLQIVLQTKHYENKWFQARAVAETAKSLAWEYKMATGELGGSSDANDILFRQIKEARLEYSRSLGKETENSSFTVAKDITEDMQRIRSLPWEEKRKIYCQDRIEKQSNWYTNKARMFRLRSKIYSIMAVAFQVAGIAIIVFFGLIRVNATSEAMLALIAMLVAGVTGWSQSMRYAEFYEPYRYTAKVLKKLKSEAEMVSTEQGFKEIVESAEHAISREHQMWQLRRGVSPAIHKHLEAPEAWRGT
jgi:hypothetical protein